jgi:hypothetical protein
MKFTGAIQFDRQLKKVFGIQRLDTLIDSRKKIRIELGGKLKGLERIETAKAKSLDIFAEKSLWLRVTTWDEYAYSKVKNAIGSDTLVFEKKTKYSTVLYFSHSIFDTATIDVFLNGSLEYDLAEPNGLNMKCFYVNFDLPALANVYDDRGMDIIIDDEIVRSLIENKYAHSVIK